MQPSRAGHCRDEGAGVRICTSSPLPFPEGCQLQMQKDLLVGAIFGIQEEWGQR